MVLLGWWIGKPMHLLFGACVRACSGSLVESALTCIPDYFEVALLLGSCFLVNYITADAKTNWVEGLIMISFYVMIVSRPLFRETYMRSADAHAARRP